VLGPPILHVTVFFGAGLWAGLVVLVPMGVVLVALAAGTAAAARGRWPGLLFLTAVLGLTVGRVEQVVESQTCAWRWEPGAHRALLQVEDAPSVQGVTSAIVRYAREGCGGRIRLALTDPVPAGALLIAAGTVRGSRVFRVEHARVLGASRALKARLRAAVAGRVRRLYGPRAPLVEALVTGRRDDLDPGLRREFAASGLAHLLAISGMHVAMLVAWVVLGLRRVMGARAAWCVGAAVSWLYVGFLAYPPPASRAAAALTVHAVARLRGRHPPSSASLAVAVLALLILTPRAATDVGAWLSVAAVWGTEASGRELPGRARRRPWARLLAASIGATIATAPITAFTFGQVAPIGVLANLVAVPLSSVAMPGVALSLVGGEIFAGGTGLVLAGIEWCARLAARVPGGNLTGDPGALFALPWTALLVFCIWFLVRRPSYPIARGRAVLAGVTALWILAVWPALNSRRGAGGMSLHVLDVGQGDAIAIETPGGHWLLVDAGPRDARGDAGRSVVLPFLRRHGVRRLDVLVTTHGDADHLGGAPSVERSLPPDLVLEPGFPAATPLYLEQLGLVDSLGVRWHAAQAGDSLWVDSVLVEVVHPAPHFRARHLATNENSLVLRVRYRGFRALLTADIGQAAESAMAGADLAADLLKVAHHGSRTSTSEAWLDRVRPRVGVISVGRNNRYGHPSAEVLARLELHGVRTYRTDRGGTVTVRTDGSYFGVAQERPPSLWENVSCWISRWLPSSDSSSSRSACTRAPPESFPTSSTTSPSPPRSSRPTSGAPG